MGGPANRSLSDSSPSSSSENSISSVDEDIARRNGVVIEKAKMLKPTEMGIRRAEIVRNLN